MVSLPEPPLDACRAVAAPLTSAQELATTGLKQPSGILLRCIHKTRIGVLAVAQTCEISTPNWGLEYDSPRDFIRNLPETASRMTHP